MPDFRIADTAPEHPKLRAAGLAAAGLWSMAGAYAMRELTDGWVPEYWVATWPGGKRAASTLIGVGLWDRESRQGIPGYIFHDWSGYQLPAKKITEDRDRARERMARIRNKNSSRSEDVRANESRTFARTEPERSEDVRRTFATSLSLKKDQNLKPTPPLPPQTPRSANVQANTPQPPRKNRRGSRIDNDFQVTPEMVAWAHEHAPDVDGRRETARFIDYWRSVPGQRGCKLDWTATWRNWMRKAHDDAAARRPHMTPSEKAASWLHLAHDADQPEIEGA